ncbi:hypothetical protein TWF730_006621 [Orbilia blumenaviensis]|uniref:F-box domain-containing protein n=1 Tax=Orbilia blumenaviensis TaxID=1796055 RepID=A0AAV9VHE4_9PEZI
MALNTFARKFLSFHRGAPPHPASRWKRNQKVFLQSFPNELIYVILDYLDRVDKCRVGRTCRSLCELAIPALYNSCELDFVNVISTNAWVARVPDLPKRPKHQVYMKYSESVRKIDLRNLHATSILRSGDERVNYSHLNLLLPQFINLKVFSMRQTDGAGPRPAAYLRAFRQVLTSCMSLTEVSIDLLCSVADVPDILAFKDQLKHEPSTAQAKLSELVIRVAQTNYNNDLTPLYHMLNIICASVGESSETVGRFRFSADVTSFHDTFDMNLCKGPLWDVAQHGQVRRVLSLPKVVNIQMNFDEATLTETLFLKYFHVDFQRVRELDLWNMNAQELYPLQQVGLILPSPNLPVELRGLLNTFPETCHRE